MPIMPILIHHCMNCSNDNPVPYTASVFSNIHHCNHCGSAATGVHIRQREEKDLNMIQQDELIGLFSRTLNFSITTPPQVQQLPPPDQKAEVPPQQPTIYASQHYVPNHHVLPVRFIPPPQNLPDQETLPLSDNEIIEMLNRNSIDPATLFPSQVALFRNADNDQRLRLLELWRISPPNLGSSDLAREQATWSSTTLLHEEQMARLRYERQEAEQSLSAPAVQSPERPSTAPESSRNRTSVQPYMISGHMMSGYETLAQREYEQSKSQTLKESTRYNQAVDPVFQQNNSPTLWNHPVLDKAVLDMENRYGTYEEMRDGDATALKGLDEDMVM